ncbi:MAG: hypothetical protein ACRC9X_00205 [Bacteroidales bacterium]
MENSIIIPMIIIGIVVGLITWVLIEMIPLLRRVTRSGTKLKDIPKGIKTQREVRTRAKSLKSIKES